MHGACCAQLLRACGCSKLLAWRLYEQSWLPRYARSCCKHQIALQAPARPVLTRCALALCPQSQVHDSNGGEDGAAGDGAGDAETASRKRKEKEAGGGGTRDSSGSAGCEVRCCSLGPGSSTFQRLRAGLDSATRPVGVAAGACSCPECPDSCRRCAAHVRALHPRPPCPAAARRGGQQRQEAGLPTLLTCASRTAHMPPTTHLPTAARRGGQQRQEAARRVERGDAPAVCRGSQRARHRQ